LNRLGRKNKRLPGDCRESGFLPEIIRAHILEQTFMNPMAAQIHSLPDLIRQAVLAYTEAVRRTLPEAVCRQVERLFVIGCGDSHHAALGAELAFEQLAGLPTEALTSLQFARYAVDALQDPARTLVIGISVSGEVARTLEGLLLARRAGALTLAFTAAPESRLGQAAGELVDTSVPALQDPAAAGLPVPGVRSYAANQIALLLAAVQLGRMRGRIDEGEAARLHGELAGLAEAARQTVEASDPAARQAAEDWQDAGEFVFLGGGPGLAAALFSAAKVLEASGDPALGQDLEEWAHLQYFARAAATPTFLITAGERDRSRAAEVALAARTIGRRLAVTAPASADEVLEQAQVRFLLPGGVREAFSPIISAIPTSLFAAYRAEMLGEPYFRGFGGGRHAEGGGGASRIRTSRMLGLE
jgi:glucosamine--fructose-6-phosphate aminotransferase (isomerizing)